MKIELDITESQYDLLLSLVFSKYDEIDRKENNLLVSRVCSMDWDESAKYDKQLKEIKKSLDDAKTLYEQVRQANDNN